jgi:hypothetical protein
VRPERGEPGVDEPPQSPLRLVVRRGEQPRPVHADRGDAALRHQRVEVRPHLRVDVVLARPVRRGHVEAAALRRRFPVRAVVVPPAAGRLPVGFDQHVEPAALVAVEVLHDEPLPVRRPVRELVPGAHEARGRQHVGDRTALPQPRHERRGRVRTGLVHDHRPAELGEPRFVGVGTHQRRPVPQIRGDTAHRRQHEVQLLPVVPVPPQRRHRLDQQHLAVGVLTAVEVLTELIAEQPQWRVVSHRRHTSNTVRIMAERYCRLGRGAR